MLVRAMSPARTDVIRAGIFATIAVLVAIVAFRGALLELVRRYNYQEEYSHGYIIPIIAAWLLWRRRDALLSSIGQPAWSGVVLIVVAAVMHVVGELGALYIFSQVGFVVALFGIALGIGGYSLLRVTFIPIIFLLFAIPLPYLIDSTLSWRLQLLSSELGVFFIRLFQIPVYLEGNVIDLGHYKLQVVEACSGLRYLYPLLSLGFLAAYLFHAPIWQRVIVFLSSIPITIVMNSFRIGMVGVMVDRWGNQSADGFLHFFEGWIIFLACAGLLAAEIYLLARISGKGFFEAFYLPKVEASLPREQGPRSANYVPAVVCLFLLLGAGFAAFFVSGRQEIVPQRTRFVAFPNTLGEWRGRPSLLEPQVEHFLGLDDYILSDYRSLDGKQINFYVAYYASQRKGSSPHSPIVCIPGGGWLITNFERTIYNNDVPGLTLPLNRVVIERDKLKQIVYYWFDQRGRQVANEWSSKWYLLTDAIFMNRTDGALVRLTTVVYPGESERDADKRLQSLLPELIPNLRGYLPSGPMREIRPTQYWLKDSRA